MLNREMHQLIMGRVLRDVYSEPIVASLLGFKGGTCAYFFYGLPRFSVDLDFDLLTDAHDSKEVLFGTVKKILESHGEVKDSKIKRDTIFFLLSYGDIDHNVKFEVNTRGDIAGIEERYELKEHLGISMLVGTKPYLFASKLSALTQRNRTAMRDIYDIWFFANNNWDIDGDVVKTLTNKTMKEHLGDCIAFIQQVKSNQILHGLGELLDEKEKARVKAHLLEEVVFLLKNYQSVLA